MAVGEWGLRPAEDAGNVAPRLLIAPAGLLGLLWVRPTWVRRGSARPGGALLGLLRRGWKIWLLQLLGL